MICTVCAVPMIQSGGTRGAQRWAGHVEPRRWSDGGLFSSLERVSLRRRNAVPIGILAGTKNTSRMIVDCNAHNSGK